MRRSCSTVAEASLPDCLSHLGRKDDAYGEVESDVFDALAEAIPDGLDGYAIAQHLDTSMVGLLRLP